MHLVDAHSANGACNEWYAFKPCDRMSILCKVSVAKGPLGIYVVKYVNVGVDSDNGWGESMRLEDRPRTLWKQGWILLSSPGAGLIHVSALRVKAHLSWVTLTWSMDETSVGVIDPSDRRISHPRVQKGRDTFGKPIFNR